MAFSTLPVAHAKNLDLTFDNYDEKTKGKTVFLKFYAPWYENRMGTKVWMRRDSIMEKSHLFWCVRMFRRCSFCKKMAGDWDRLSHRWKGHDVGLVAEVDCTNQKSGGKKLCEYLGIESFPTLKYGDPSDLWDYEGGRSFQEMHEFAQENLVPLCSVDHLELCDSDTKKILEGYVKMDKLELKGLIEAEEKKLTNAEAEYKARVNQLTKMYEQAEANRQKAVDAVMKGNLGMMRQVMLARDSEQDNGEKDAGDSSKEEL